MCGWVVDGLVRFVSDGRRDGALLAGGARLCRRLRVVDSAGEGLMADYDSTADTLDHIDKVRENLDIFVGELDARSWVHDESKLKSPEKEIFDRVTPKLRGLTYGSEEYKAGIAELGVALAHHYAENSHHPEHFVNGVDGMTLVDIVEMYCDWAAAAKRHADGNFERSLEINRERFGISEQLAQIFENTRCTFGW